MRRNEHGAFLVCYKNVLLAAHTERDSAQKLCAELASDPEVLVLAAGLPSGTKIRHGAAAAVINDAHGRESSDYAVLCQMLWAKVKKARAKLQLS